VQIVRYTFVGGLAFLVDFGVLFALTQFLGIHYLVSAAGPIDRSALVYQYIGEPDGTRLSEVRKQQTPVFEAGCR
jgi:hypothetical protein